MTDMIQIGKRSKEAQRILARREFLKDIRGAQCRCKRT